jgi:hypothetical protein
MPQPATVGADVVPGDGPSATPPAEAPGPYGGRGPDPAFPLGYDPATPDAFSRLITRASRRTPAWAGPAALAGCCAAASAYVLLWGNPTDSGADDMPSCLVRLTTGYDCPGCGGTRAFWYLLHGDLPAAAHHHMLFVFAVPFLIYAYVAWAAGTMFNVRLPQLRISMRGISIILGVWAVFTVLRNLPFAPFSLFYV